MARSRFLSCGVAFITVFGLLLAGCSRGPSEEELAQARFEEQLTVLQQQKDLSDREKRMLEKARYLLVSEMAAAEDLTDDRVEDKIDKALGTLIKKLETEH